MLATKIIAEANKATTMVLPRKIVSLRVVK